MYPYTTPTDLYQEYQARVAQAVRQHELARRAWSAAARPHPQEDGVALDFTDYNLQRLAVFVTQQRGRALAPPRNWWRIIRRWTPGVWSWMPQIRRRREYTA